ncbi:MAG: DUF6390 family protein, partial [Candidatus Nanopelagicales bacterium]
RCGQRAMSAGPRPSGALRFARYAYPPNELGFCGPDAAGQILEQVAAGADDPDLRGLLHRFEGAWPYLELIAGCAGIDDPLDDRVVEAYWLGNDLLDGVGITDFGRSLTDRFRPRAGAGWSALAEAIPAGAVPHHSTHVLAVYPWVGLLRAGRTVEPLHVLDRCRIRWGRVESVLGDEVLVTSQPLAWDGRALYLGARRVEVVRAGTAGVRLVTDLGPGDWCALHWDWVCERLDARRLAALQHWSAGTLALVNATAHPAPAAVLS